MTEIDELNQWCQDSLTAFFEEPDDADILASFRDARRALDQAKVARGFYPVRNPNDRRFKQNAFRPKGRGKGKGGDSDKLCVRCGKKGHEARNCYQRDRGDARGSSGSSAKVGFVGLAYDMACDKDSIMHTTDNDESETHVWTTEPSRVFHRGKAVIDSGASDNVIGVNSMQEMVNLYEDLGLDFESEVSIDRSMHKNFVYGSDHSSAALGLSKVNTGILGHEVNIETHMIEGSTPFLLSAKFLYDMKATINFHTGVAQFATLSERHFQLERGPGNHLMLPITQFAGLQDEINQVMCDDDAHVKDLTSSEQTSESADDASATVQRGTPAVSDH